jgi:hypothetical protein
MKFLTDSEILKWSQELGLNLNPVYSKLTGHPDIVLSDNLNYDTLVAPIKKTESQIINYRFTFSVSENRVDDFFRILETLLSEKLETKFIVDRPSLHYNENRFNNSIIKDIEISDSIYTSSSEVHEIWKRRFVRFTYNFNCHFTSVMGYISYLTDAIDYVGMLWGYNEDGEEIKLLKHNIGDIVSTIDDKSKDLIILDYKFTKRNSEKVIDYILSELIGDKRSSVIKYNNIIILPESKLAFSRNNRIDNILN